MTVVNRILGSQKVQPALLENKPNGIFPPEIVEKLIIFTNQSETNRLVSRDWNALTFTVDKNSKKYELKQTIQLITETLFADIHAQIKTDLAEIQAAHHSLSKSVVTHTQMQRLFLISKGFVLGELKKVNKHFGIAFDIRNQLPEGYKDIRLPVPEEGAQRQKAITPRLPDSMKDIFMLAGLTIFSPEDYDKATFFTLLQSHPFDRGTAIQYFVKINKKEPVKLILADGPIPKFFLEYAVQEAAKDNNLELVRLLLANGPISSSTLNYALQYATRNNNLELVELLQAYEPKQCEPSH